MQANQLVENFQNFQNWDKAYNSYFSYYVCRLSIIGFNDAKRIITYTKGYIDALDSLTTIGE